MDVTLKLSDEMVAALRATAARDDVTVGQLVRDALARELRRRNTPKRDVRTDEALLAPVRSLLAPDLARATGWADLAQRLAQFGFALKPAGGGLIVVRLPEGRRVCKASELGHAHLDLARRFGGPFPGHSQSATILSRLGNRSAGPSNRPGQRQPQCPETPR